MKVQTRRIFIAALISFLLLPSTLPKGGENMDSGSLPSLCYNKAFDQEKIFRRFRDLIEHWGCAKNVFREHCDACGTQQENHDAAYWEKRTKEYERACLSQLAWERRIAIGRPAINASIYLALLATGTYLTNKVIDKNSFGGSFATTKTIIDSLFILAEITQVGVTLWRTPQHAVDDLEKEYALNQCFIPRQLWPMITREFTTARTNHYEETKSINFIKFALGFTLFKPQPPVVMHLPGTSAQKIALQPIIDEVLRRVEAFFADYDTTPEQLAALKTGIGAFIEQLVTGSEHRARYQYFYGSYGKGKNQFVTQLAVWLDELLPNSVHYEEFKVSTPAELEGSQEQAGLLLNTLRNQLQAHKRGTIIFMDEATWLNNDSLLGDAKRVFNENFAKISTQYFGRGIGGCNLKFALPPTLIFIVSNEPIKNSALSSRFDCMPFPEPKKEALIRYAVAVFKYGRMDAQGLEHTESMLYRTAQTTNIDGALEEELRSELGAIIDKKPSPLAKSILKYMNNIETIDNFRDAGIFGERFAALKMGSAAH